MIAPHDFLFCLPRYLRVKELIVVRNWGLRDFLFEQFINVEEQPELRGWQGDILGWVFHITLPEFFIERPGSC